MRRDLATCPAPDLQQPSIEVRILLQPRDVEDVSSLSLEERSETGLGKTALKNLLNAYH